jgi:hypothetical protein
MMLQQFYIGVLSVEGDEHKHQVRLFVSRFVRELLSNTTSSARFWSVTSILGYWGVKCLTIR